MPTKEGYTPFVQSVIVGIYLCPALRWFCVSADVNYLCSSQSWIKMFAALVPSSWMQLSTVMTLLH
jgi:hypothetical protein